MPRLIRFTDTRRGNLGGSRYREFEEGETYAVDETAGANDTITPFLADQFVDAGVAVEVDADDAPAKSSDSSDSDGDAPENLGKMRTAELEAVAESEGISLDEAKTNAAKVTRIETTRLVRTVMTDRDGLGERTAEDLGTVASALNIEGRSDMNKDALVAALTERIDADDADGADDAAGGTSAAGDAQ